METLADWRSPQFAIGAVGDAVLKHKTGSAADLIEFRGLLDLPSVIEILRAFSAHGLIQLTMEDNLTLFALPTDPNAAKKLKVETQKLLLDGSKEVVDSWLAQKSANAVTEGHA